MCMYVSLSTAVCVLVCIHIHLYLSVRTSVQLLDHVMCSMESAITCVSRTFSIRPNASADQDMFWEAVEYHAVVSCACLPCQYKSLWTVHMFVLSTLHLEYDAASPDLTCQLPCTHLCTARGPTHTCRCYPGYQLAEDGVTCGGNAKLRSTDAWIHTQTCTHSS